MSTEQETSGPVTYCALTYHVPQGNIILHASWINKHTNCVLFTDDRKSEKKKTRRDLQKSKFLWFLISNFRRVLNLVCILLGISPASDYGLPTFRNALPVPSSKAGCEVWMDVKYEVLHTSHPLKMELIECFETSANHNQTPGKYPKEYRQEVFMESRVHLWLSHCCGVCDSVTVLNLS